MTTGKSKGNKKGKVGRPRKSQSERVGGLSKSITIDNSVDAPASSMQVGGDHYKKMAIQPMEYAHGNKMGPIEFNCLRYISRWESKGGLQDLDKAIHCLQFLKEMELKKAGVK